MGILFAKRSAEFASLGATLTGAGPIVKYGLEAAEFAIAYADEGWEGVGKKAFWKAASIGATKAVTKSLGRSSAGAKLMRKVDQVLKNNKKAARAVEVAMNAGKSRTQAEAEVRMKMLLLYQGKGSLFEQTKSWEVASGKDPMRINLRNAKTVTTGLQAKDFPNKKLKVFGKLTAFEYTKEAKFKDNYRLPGWRRSRKVKVHGILVGQFGGVVCADNKVKPFSMTITADLIGGIDEIEEDSSANYILNRKLSSVEVIVGNKPAKSNKEVDHIKEGMQDVTDRTDHPFINFLKETGLW